MTTALIHNLAAYSAQIVLVAVVCGGLPRLLRLSAGVQYGFWRALLAFCVALPLFQPRQGAVSLAARPMMPAGLPSFVASTSALATGRQVDWPYWLTLLLALGAAVQLAWMAAGLVRLQRYRRMGTRDGEGGAWAGDLQRLIGTCAEVRWLAELRQPVTFGLRRPVVLLPASLRDQSGDVQRAVMAHELFHVARRDWCWVIAEEVLRSAFWFNPAARWLITRVQLAREAVVDELTVMLTGSRRTYLLALLAFADGASPLGASRFSRRRHLFHRMLLISGEAAMSSTRFVVSCAAMVLVIGAAGWGGAAAFPLTASGSQNPYDTRPGPLEQVARAAATPHSIVGKRITYVAPAYPPEFKGTKEAGTVTLQITIDGAGNVAECRPLSFVATEVDAAVDQDLARERFATAAVAAARQWTFAPPSGGPATFTATVSNDPDVPPDTTHPIRVGGGIKPPTLIKDVRPVYPPEAMAQRVQGVVIIEARIDAQGSVATARILRSVPMLDQAALDAVRQWKFRPTLLNGAPVPVIMTMTVNFTLAK